MIRSNCGFEYDVSQDRLLLTVCGEVDHHSAAPLRQDVDELICRHRPRRLVMDLSGVGFMDSSGLGFIMGRYSLLRDLGGSMVIIDPSPATQRMLSLAGIKRIIPIETTQKGDAQNDD